MFLLRCGFFLSIVWITIAFGGGALRGPHGFEAGVARQASGIADAAVASATDWCAGHPARCARDAARLTALVEMATAVPASDDADVAPTDAEASRMPMPVPDPRRRAARALLTDAR